MNEEEAERAPIRRAPLYMSFAGTCYIDKWESILDSWEEGYAYSKEEIECNVRELLFWLSIVRREWSYVNTAFIDVSPDRSLSDKGRQRGESVRILKSI